MRERPDDAARAVIERVRRCVVATVGVAWMHRPVPLRREARFGPLHDVRDRGACTILVPFDAGERLVAVGIVEHHAGVHGARHRYNSAPRNVARHVMRCMGAVVQLADLRRYAIARSLFAARDLQHAIDRLGFVQADPIRAPARAQDLALRHRVAGYRAGDLDRSYPTLAVEEDFFVNYGFVARDVYALMHPRRTAHRWGDARRRRARAVLAFVAGHGDTHPREVEARFAHGAVVNAWGGSSNATTHLLDAMHYRGWLRVARRRGGIRIYSARMERSDAQEL